MGLTLYAIDPMMPVEIDTPHGGVLNSMKKKMKHGLYVKPS